MTKPNVGIVTFPLRDAGIISLKNVVDVFSSPSNELFLITGNQAADGFRDDERVHLHEVIHTEGVGFISRIKNYVSTQWKISRNIIELSGNVDSWFFSIGGEKLLLPMLAAKITGKKVTIILAGFTSQWEKSTERGLLFPKVLLTQLNLYLADYLIAYSPILVDQWDLGQFRHKILYASQHVLDFTRYRILSSFDQRENIIGFIGRLSEEKGVLNLIEAIPSILHEKPDVSFLIIGDGDLRPRIQDYLSRHDLGDKVEMTGWIPHNELPRHLNRCKMIVMPSYTEGLPNLLFEAMACGTLVLASPVGAIPDSIEDGKNGFLMDDNSPETIAFNILRVLDTPLPESIVEYGRSYVESRYTREATIDRHQQIFKHIGLVE